MSFFVKFSQLEQIKNDSNLLFTRRLQYSFILRATCFQSLVFAYLLKLEAALDRRVIDDSDPFFDWIVFIERL